MVGQIPQTRHQTYAPKSGGSFACLANNYARHTSLSHPMSD